MFLLALREIDKNSVTIMKSKEEVTKVTKASLACPLLVGIHRGSL